jgi:hypothetical protein
VAERSGRLTDSLHALGVADREPDQLKLVIEAFEDTSKAGVRVVENARSTLSTRLEVGNARRTKLEPIDHNEDAFDHACGMLIHQHIVRSRCRTCRGPLALSAWELACQVSLSSTLQVSRHLRLSVSARQVPTLPPQSGTERARHWGLGPGNATHLDDKHAMVAIMSGYNDSCAGTDERRGQAIIAFLGAGMHDAPSPALAVQALVTARRSVAACRARNESITIWLAGEIRLPGIK